MLQAPTRRRSPWTPAEDALLRAQHAAGTRYADIAALLPGRSAGACSERARTLGIAATKAPDWAAAEALGRE